MEPQERLNLENRQKEISKRIKEKLCKLIPKIQKLKQGMHSIIDQT
jgi:hypothetical protein